MKHSFFLVLVALSLCISCSKQTITPQLKGEWKLTEVEDIANDSLVAHSNPEDIVTVEFQTSNGTSNLLHARTSFNTIQTEYLVNDGSSIELPYYVCSKTYDTPLGRSFLDNIGFAKTYTILGPILYIMTSNLIMLKFTRR